MMKYLQLGATLMLTSAALAQAPTPKNGFIPDEATAIKVAEAILIPIYGEKVIHGERPFHGTLLNGTWKVSGTLEKPKNPRFLVDGGTAEILLDQKTGAVISYTHYK